MVAHGGEGGEDGGWGLELGPLEKRLTEHGSDGDGHVSIAAHLFGTECLCIAISFHIM